MRKYITSLIFLLVILFVLPMQSWAATTRSELVLGSRGDDVKYLQSKLQESGFYPSGKVNGYFGLTTLMAVSKFEEKNNLTRDGKVTAQDWGIIDPSKNNNSSSNLVLGYYTQYSSADKLSEYSLQANAGQIDFSAFFSFALNSDGSLQGEIPWNGLSIAKKNNVKGLLVVHNMTGSMDGSTVHQVLNSYTRRQTLIKNITSLLQNYGFSGVNIDFESIKSIDGAVYNQFLKELNQALKPKGFLITVAVPSKTTSSLYGDWYAAYDYKTIGQLVDYVVLMTYDEHWSGGTPGPIASLSWVQKVIGYATSTISANKLLMGVAAYGYDWSSARSGASAVMWKNVSKLSQYGTITWDDESCTPYIKYIKDSIKHEAWLENKYSLALKLNLVKQYNLGGIAIWRLGYEDNDFWQVVREKM